MKKNKDKEREREKEEKGGELNYKKGRFYFRSGFDYGDEGKLCSEEAEFLKKYRKHVKIDGIRRGRITAILADKKAYESGALKKLKNLRNVYLVGEISNLDGKKLPQKLEVIDIGGCEKLKNYDLRYLKNLYYINFSETEIMKLDGSLLPESLEIIDARACKNLKTCYLANLKNLKKLFLIASPIQSLDPNKLPESLKEIYVSNYVDVNALKADPRFRHLRII
ncbi:MAG: hypothetical protein QW244_00755 [Candidatus Pacearchaeota archaeon]